MMARQRDKLAKNLSGIKNMSRVPGLLFVVDAKKEKIAVDEANKLGIPMIAICDTNSDPDLITVPIAGNDDAIRSVELITAAIADTIIEARRESPVREEGEDGEGGYTYSSDRGAEPASAEDRNAKKRRPRRRHAKPEAIALRIKEGTAVEGEAAQEVPEGEVAE
jgi:small subunit ribosomal protein S2